MKSMQNVYEIAKRHGVDHSVSIAHIVLNNFENACITKPRKRLSRKGFASQLGLTQGKADSSFDVIRK